MTRTRRNYRERKGKMYRERPESGEMSGDSLRSQIGLATCSKCSVECPVECRNRWLKMTTGVANDCGVFLLDNIRYGNYDSIKGGTVDDELIVWSWNHFDKRLLISEK